MSSPDPADTPGFKDLLRDRWESLPAAVQTAQQVAGKAAIGCGATHGLMERCNLACTSCYLTDIANATPPLTFRDACRQLDQLKAWLGPKGKVQITSGEVTLLPQEELGALIAYAVQIGLDPMVMTNGVRLLREPQYLRALVSDYGLRKICFHVDSTQRGRGGISSLETELEQNPVRKRCAELLTATRQTTGQRIDAAHTVTVTAKNIDEVGGIVRWFLDHSEQFRLLSLLPVANVGRTEDDRTENVNLDSVWSRVEAAIGRPLNRHAMHFGHSACSITVPLLVVESGEHRSLLEVVRSGVAWDQRIFTKLTRLWGPVLDSSQSLVRNAARLLAVCVKSPLLLPELSLYTGFRLLAARGLALHCLLGLFALRAIRMRPILFVLHAFMDAETMASEEGKDRLAACIFKLPVGDRLVPMCEMNGSTMRLELNRSAQDTRSS